MGYLISTHEAITPDWLTWLHRWNLDTFGPGLRTEGVTDHIAKELDEIRSEPTDLTEWADVILLALAGAMRTGATGDDVIEAIRAKHERNTARQWPDWRTAEPGKAIEHVRGDK
jgi:hypothetical protein